MFAVNHTIVQAPGGHLWAENSPDPGAACHLTPTIAQ